MYGIGRKQNPKESPLHIKKRNWIISNRLSVIQIQHRKSVLGHSVFPGPNCVSNGITVDLNTAEIRAYRHTQHTYRHL